MKHDHLCEVQAARPRCPMVCYLSDVRQVLSGEVSISADYINHRGCKR